MSILASMTQRAEAAVVSIQANTNPGITPNQRGLPGLSVLREIIGAAAFWALIACVAGLVISGAALAFAKTTDRGGMADRSKTGVLWAAIGSVLIGGANAIVRFFADSGSEI